MSVPKFSSNLLEADEPSVQIAVFLLFLYGFPLTICQIL